MRRPVRSCTKRMRTPTPVPYSTIVTRCLVTMPVNRTLRLTQNRRTSVGNTTRSIIYRTLLRPFMRQIATRRVGTMIFRATFTVGIIRTVYINRQYTTCVLRMVMMNVKRVNRACALTTWCQRANRRILSIKCVYECARLGLPMTTITCRLVNRTKARTAVLRRLNRRLRTIRTLETLRPTLRQLTSTMIMMRVTCRRVNVILFNLNVRILGRNKLCPIIKVCLSKMFAHDLISTYRANDYRAFIKFICGLRAKITNNMFVTSVLTTITTAIISRSRFSDLRHLYRRTICAPTRATLNVMCECCS